MQSNIPILCTRPLDKLLIEQAREKGIDIDVSVFIETESIESVEVQQEIEAVLNLSATVIFTSMNAVEAVLENLIDEQPDWDIYCIGYATRELVEKHFPSAAIAGTADNATELAALILATAHSEELFFFCGRQRRDELPDVLRRHNIEVNEIVVYETISLPHKVTKEYFGILFFSPSAAESFFIKNKLMPQTILFAIGNTTASMIRKYSNNKILVADQPGKEMLVEKMIEYFT